MDSLKQYVVQNLPRLSFGLAALVMCALYWPITNVTPCYDEWQWLLPTRGLSGHDSWAGLIEIFTEPIGQFYRPLSSLPMALADGADLSLPLRLKLLFVIGIAILVVTVLNRIQPVPSVSWYVGGAFLIHQCLVLPGEIDWWGDAICDASLLLLFILHFSSKPTRSLDGGLLIMTLLLTAMATWSKEAGVTAPLIVLVSWGAANGWNRVVHRALPSIMVSSLVVVVYLLVRSQIGIELAVEGDDYYRLSLGKNLLLNPGTILVGTLSPVNTVSFALGGIWPKILTVMWTLLGIGLVAWGLKKSELFKSQLLWSLVAAALLIQGPTLLMPHISEGNFARSLPFTLAICGVSLSYIWKYYSLRIRILLLTIIAIWVVFNLVAVKSKVSDLVAIHAKAENFRSQIKELMPTPPSRMIRFAIETAPYGYSIYRQPLALLVKGDADLGMRFEYGLPDYTVDLRFVDNCDSLLHSGWPDFCVKRNEEVLKLPQ